MNTLQQIYFTNRLTHPHLGGYIVVHIKDKKYDLKSWGSNPLYSGEIVVIIEENPEIEKIDLSDTFVCLYKNTLTLIPKIYLKPLK